MKLPRFNLIRSIESQKLLDYFIITSVVTILSIRIYLELTGYPQLGGGELHIAHMLWGGLMLALAFLFQVFFLNKEVKYFTVILAGVGFGFFIDELGKFITNDNNYFYRPTFALIYLVFLLIYVLFRRLINRRFTSEEYLINAIEEMKEVVEQDLDEDEKKKALDLIRKSDLHDEFTQSLYSLIEKSKTIPIVHDERFSLFEKRLREWYFSFIHSKWFIRLFVILAFLNMLSLIIRASNFIPAEARPRITIAEFMQLTFSFIGFILLIPGFINLQNGKLLPAYLWFRRSLYVSIFVVQFFTFYIEQLLGIFELVGSVTLLVIFNYLITKEQEITPNK